MLAGVIPIKRILIKCFLSFEKKICFISGQNPNTIAKALAKCKKVRKGRSKSKFKTLLVRIR